MLSENLRETSIKSLGTRRVYRPTEQAKNGADHELTLQTYSCEGTREIKQTYELYSIVSVRAAQCPPQKRNDNSAVQMESDVQKLQVTLGWNAVVPNRIDNFCNSTQASSGLRMPLMWFAGVNKQWGVTSTCKACTDWAHFNGISQSCPCQGLQDLQASMVHSPLNMVSWKLPLWALCRSIEGAVALCFAYC